MHSVIEIEMLSLLLNIKCVYIEILLQRIYIQFSITQYPSECIFYKFSLLITFAVVSCSLWISIRNVKTFCAQSSFVSYIFEDKMYIYVLKCNLYTIINNIFCLSSFQCRNVFDFWSWLHYQYILLWNIRGMKLKLCHKKKVTVTLYLF